MTIDFHSLLSFVSLNEMFGQPPDASEHGGKIDHMLEAVHWFMAVLFFGWTTFFFVVLFKFNRRVNPKASYVGVQSHFTTHLEVLVVIVEVVLLLGFAFPQWSQRVDSMPDASDPSVLRVRAVGEQFGWTFHYAGHDGRFGLVRPDRIGGSNPVGLVMEDPSAADDFFSRELILPKGRKVVVQVSSKDVIHNLSLVSMRIQQDAIPGTEIPMWFVPAKTGTWDIICGQLCGAGHAKMKATMEVQDAETFDAYFKQRSDAEAAKNVKPAAGTPAAPAAAAAPAPAH